MPTAEEIFDAEVMPDAALIECRTTTICRGWDEISGNPIDDDFSPIGLKVKVLVFESYRPHRRHWIPACVVIDSRDKEYFNTEEPWDTFAQALVRA